MSEESKLERYIKSIPPAYKPGTNVFITALIKALAKADSDVETQVGEAKNQIFVKRAESKFLDSLGSNVGVDRPVTINLSDDKFRELIPTLSFKPKQVRATMYDILDVFWGPLYSRANITGEASEPYDFGNIGSLTGTSIFQNKGLTVVGSGSSYTTEVLVGDYIKFINHDNEFFARVSKIESNILLRLSEPYSGGAAGVSSSGTANIYTPLDLTINVDGGDTKTITLKPNLFSVTSAVTAEEVANTINAELATSTTTEQITASIFEDFVLGLKFLNLRTDTPGPTGSLKIVGGTANIFAFGVQNFSGTSTFVSNAEGSLFTNGEDVVVGSSAVTNFETTITAINIDTPVTGTTEIQVADNVDGLTLLDECFIYKKGHLGFGDEEILVTRLPQSTIIYELNQKELIIRIPATVPALRRSLEGSAHLRSGFWRGSITAVDNVLKRLTVDLVDEPVALNFFAEKTLSSQLNEFTIVSNTEGITGVTIQFSLTDDLSVFTNDSFVVLDDVFRGSFLFDPENALFTATSARCTLNETLSKGSVFPSINVTGASGIPDGEGFLIFDFGRTGEEQPVKYRGRPNNNTLLLNPAHIFEKNHEVGEIINVLVFNLEGTRPRVTGEDLATYVTGIVEARLIVQQLLRDTKAAGISLTFIIDAPEYLWTTGRPPSE